MGLNLYIDDVRAAPEGFTHVARTFNEAQAAIQKFDWDRISFDHDLGSDSIYENGLTLMNRLEELVFLEVRTAPYVEVHSANAGAQTAMRQCADKINSMRKE